MTKGKYKARAANREVARDNELIVEKIAEIATLKATLVETEGRLQKERSERSALVVARADELSAEQISATRAEAEQQVAGYVKDMRTVADFLAEYFHREERYPTGFIDVVLPLLIPDSVQRNEMVNAVFEDHPFCPDHAGEEMRIANRSIRRHAADNIARSTKKSRAKDSGVDFLVRKGLVPEEELEQKALPSSERGLI